MKHETDMASARAFAVKWALRDSAGDIANLARAFLRLRKLCEEEPVSDFVERVCRELPMCDLNSRMAKDHLIKRLCEREESTHDPSE